MNVHEMIEDAIASEKRTRRERKMFVKNHKDEMFAVANGLIDVQRYIIDLSYDGITALDLRVAGDHHVFKGTWSALRKMGYKTSMPVKDDKFASWSAYFHKEGSDLSVWLSFASTKCTRKKVGTKMVEQDVYEVVCE